MAYVRKTLAPGEEYLYRAKFNWTFDFVSWFWLAIGLIPTAIWAYVLVNNNLYTDAFGWSFTIPAAVAFATGGLIWLTRHVYKWTTVVAITSIRLILKKGLIAWKTHEVSLDKIEEILVHQSFFGRLVGFGVLTIRGTGVAVIEFPALARPMKIRRKIEEAVAQARCVVKETMKLQPKSEPAPMAAVAT